MPARPGSHPCLRQPRTGTAPLTPTPSPHRNPMSTAPFPGNGNWTTESRKRVGKETVDSVAVGQSCGSIGNCNPVSGKCLLAAATGGITCSQRSGMTRDLHADAETDRQSRFRSVCHRGFSQTLDPSGTTGWPAASCPATGFSVRSGVRSGPSRFVFRAHSGFRLVHRKSWPIVPPDSIPPVGRRRVACGPGEYDLQCCGRSRIGLWIPGTTSRG